MLPRYYRYLNISNDPFNRQELLDSVTTKKIYTIAMWKKWGYKDKLFKEEFHSWLASLGCYVANAELFHIPPKEQLVWHLDMWPAQDFIKINFVWNSDDHNMLWGRCINATKEINISTTTMNTAYVKYEDTEIELLEKTKIREDRPIIVNVGVPHKVINYSTTLSRWCVSIVLHHNGKRILFDDAVNIFSEYVVD